MKKLHLALISLALMMAMPSFVSAKDNKTNKASKVYFFGTARCFLDSLTFVTPIVPIDNVAMEKSVKDIANIEMYTNQLEDYFRQMGMQGYVCTTFYAYTHKKCEKLYLKIRRKLNKDKGTRVETLSTTDFVYKWVDPSTIYRNEIQEATRPDPLLMNQE